MIIYYKQDAPLELRILSVLRSFYKLLQAAISLNRATAATERGGHPEASIFMKALRCPV